VKLVEFEMAGEESAGRYTVTINPEHVESVQSADYDNVKCTELVMASGAKHYVKGDYPDVMRRLRGQQN